MRNLQGEQREDAEGFAVRQSEVIEQLQVPLRGREGAEDRYQHGVHPLLRAFRAGLQALPPEGRAKRRRETSACGRFGR